MKKSILILCLLFSLLYTKAHAGSVSITEIMYDLEGSDSTREWVEVYNNTGSAIDLTKYKFVENGTAHGITHLEGSENLPSGSYAIIADNAGTFYSEHSSLSKSHIYDSAFSLSNGVGESLSIKDPSGNILFEINYDVSLGAAGDGESLQSNSSGIWSVGNPTPLSGQSSIEENDNTPADESDNYIEKEPTYTYQKDPKMVVQFDIPKTAIAGSKIILKSTIFGYSGETITAGKFMWNFGDGHTITNNYNTPVEHIYAFPGTYTIFQSFRYEWYAKPTVVGLASITVIESPIIVTDFYTTPFPAVRIKNTKTGEYDISGYIIKTGINNVVIPEGTYIGSKGDIVFVLPAGDYNKNDISITHPSGYLASSFPTPDIESIKPLTVASASSGVDYLMINQEDEYVVQNTPAPDVYEVIDLDNSQEPDTRNFVPYLSLVAVIILGGLSMFFLYRNKNQSVSDEESDEYALQDE